MHQHFSYRHCGSDAYVHYNYNIVFYLAAEQKQNDRQLLNQNDRQSTLSILLVGFHTVLGYVQTCIKNYLKIKLLTIILRQAACIGENKATFMSWLLFHNRSLLVGRTRFDMLCSSPF